MTALRQVWLMCDVCGEEADRTGLTVVEARKKARTVGWIRIGTKDICPLHKLNKATEEKSKE